VGQFTQCTSRRGRIPCVSDMTSASSSPTASRPASSSRQLVNIRQATQPIVASIVHQVRHETLLFCSIRCDNSNDRSNQGGAVKIRSDAAVGQRVVELLGSRPQRELAEAVGMQPSVLSRALTGARAFNMSEIVDIADYLGVRVEELLFDEQPAFAMRGAAHDETTQAVVAQCSHLIDAMLQIEAVGR
jgi:hypothetical protein